MSVCLYKQDKSLYKQDKILFSDHQSKNDSKKYIDTQNGIIDIHKQI